MAHEKRKGCTVIHSIAFVIDGAKSSKFRKFPNLSYAVLLSIKSFHNASETYHKNAKNITHYVLIK